MADLRVSCVLRPEVALACGKLTRVVRWRSAYPSAVIMSRCQRHGSTTMGYLERAHVVSRRRAHDGWIDACLNGRVGDSSPRCASRTETTEDKCRFSPHHVVDPLWACTRRGLLGRRLCAAGHRSYPFHGQASAPHACAGGHSAHSILSCQGTIACSFMVGHSDRTTCTT